MTDDDDAALFEIVRQRSFRKGKFRLSSGAESELYFNLKPTMMDPRGAYLSARAFLERVRSEKADFVGGVEMGAVPIIGSLAAISEVEGHPVRTFFVRKVPKTHGTMDLIEGLAPNETLEGKRVVVADDVATTGSSILKAVDVVRKVGAIVESALVLVDREEGAAELLEKHGVRLLSVFRGREFL
ncbi:MAG: orotate phosphoribosyltransferase [Rhizomicrobium sp.]|jgi:orotate phosphoribosyltransferase